MTDENDVELAQTSEGESKTKGRSRVLTGVTLVGVTLVIVGLCLVALAGTNWYFNRINAQDQAQERPVIVQALPDSIFTIPGVQVSPLNVNDSSFVDPECRVRILVPNTQTGERVANQLIKESAVEWFTWNQRYYELQRLRGYSVTMMEDRGDDIQNHKRNLHVYLCR